MAGTRITIELDDAALRAILGKLAASIADPSPALAKRGAAGARTPGPMPG